MYIIRDIFHLQFGHYREAKTLLQEAYSNGLLPDSKDSRVLSDFTGDSYRLILEDGYDTLADYEDQMGRVLSNPGWQPWYDRFKPLIMSGEREILKTVL